MRTINSEYRKNPLVDFFANDDLSENFLLYAGGGYGKTTAMLCLNEFLLEKAKQGEKIVPLFIDVKELDSEYGKSNILIDYIRKNYCGNETNATEKGKSNSELLELFFEGKLNYTNKERYRFVILLDGFNEATKDMQNTLVNEINTLKTNDNVKFVVSSRTDDFNIDFKRIVLNGLSKEQIVKFLENKFSNDFDVNKISKSLLEILQVPLFLDVFSKTYDDNSSFPDIYEEKSVRKANILNSYVNKILSDIDTKSETRKEVLEFTLNYWLPAVAFEMSKEKSFRIGSNTPAKLLDSDYFINRLGYDDEEIRKIKNSEFFYPKTICEKDFSLISTSNGNLQFNHHIWRDFFAAKHITNILRLNPEYITEEALKNLEITLDETIYRFVGELITDENGRCECDFERKRDLENPSPIESFMQNVQRKENKLSATATKNLIKIMKVSRNNYITARYDNLDLSETSFLNCDLPNSSFKNALITLHSFYPKGHDTTNKIKAVFSNSGNVLCSISFDNYKMILYNLRNNKFKSFKLSSLISSRFKEIDELSLEDFYAAAYITNDTDVLISKIDMAYSELKKNTAILKIYPQNRSDFIIVFGEDEKELSFLRVAVDENYLSSSEIMPVGNGVNQPLTSYNLDNIRNNCTRKYDFGEYSIVFSQSLKEKIKILKKGELIKEISRKHFNQYSFERDVLCYDGNTKIAIQKNNDIEVWDLEIAQKVSTLFGKCKVKQTKCLPNDYWIVSCTDNRIRCYSNTGELKKIFCIDDEIEEFEVFAKGECLLVGSLTNLYTINLKKDIVLNIDSFEDDLFSFKVYEEGVIIAFAACDDPNATRVYTYENDSPEKLIFQSSRHYCFLHGKELLVNAENSEIISKQGSNYYEIWNYKTGEVYDAFTSEIYKSDPETIVTINNELEEMLQKQKDTQTKSGESISCDFMTEWQKNAILTERNRIINSIYPMNILGVDFSKSLLKPVEFRDRFIVDFFYKELQNNGAKVPEKYTTAEGFYTFD